MSDDATRADFTEPMCDRDRTLGDLLHAGFLTRDQSDELARALPAGSMQQRHLGRALLDRGWLTAFQVNRFLQGRAGELSVGSCLIIDLLGEGGMGQVFRARHRTLGRVVALKVIHPGRMGGDASRRFEREVRAVARLSHPNVVAALDAGEANGSLYLVMELIEGRDLRRVVREDGPLPVAVACEYARQAALALQHAHEAGLVHRDVKPSNLIVTARGEVKLLDLGLARAEPADGETISTLTESGVVAGTPDYIAPEQIRDSRDVDIRADLYSLGCTLYHLLAGRPPFSGAATAQKYHLHQSAEPPPLSSIRDDVPRVVSAFVARLMAKNPDDRYRTPGEAAEVLGRLLHEGRCEVASAFENLEDATALIEPRRPAATGGLSRRLLLAGGLAAAAVGTVGGLAWWLARPAKISPPDEPRASALDRLRHDRLPAGERRGLAPPEVVRVMGTSAGRHWAGVTGLAFSPDGKHLVSTGLDGFVAVHDALTLERRATLRLDSPVTGLAMSHDGQSVQLWVSGKLSGRLSWHWKTGAGEVTGRGADRLAQCVSPDGSRGIYAWSNRVELIDALGGDVLYRNMEMQAPPHGHLGRAFSPDGQFAIVPGSRRGEILILDAASGRVTDTLAGDAHWVTALAFLDDGKRFLAGDLGGQVKLWDLPGRKALFTVGHGAWVHGLGVSVDGKRAVSAGAKEIRFWDLERRSTDHVRATEGTTIEAVAFHPDGRHVATGDLGGRVRLWDAVTAEDKSPKWAFRFWVMSIAFSPDGARVSAAGNDEVATWAVDGAEPEWALAEPKSAYSVAISPDGALVLVGGHSGKVRLRDATDGKLIRSLTGHADEARAVAFVPGGPWCLVAGGHPGKAPAGQKLPDWALADCAVKSWDVATGEPGRRLVGHTSPVRSMSVSADGSRLLTCAGGPTDVPDVSIRLWDVAAGRELRRVATADRRGMIAVALSPDGMLAAGVPADLSLSVFLWDLAGKSDEPFAELRGHAAQPVAVCFAPEGRRLCTADAGGVVRRWTAEGKTDGSWKLPGKVHALAFAPDGKHLATANADGTVYLLRVGGRA